MYRKNLMWYYCHVDNKLLLKIKEIDFSGYYGRVYTSEEINFLVTVLKEDHDDEIYIAALSVFTLAIPFKSLMREPTFSLSFIADETPI